MTLILGRKKHREIRLPMTEPRTVLKRERREHSKTIRELPSEGGVLKERLSMLT